MDEPTDDKHLEAARELAELVVRLGHYAEHWPTTYDSDRKARKLFADAALAIKELTTQRDHYHTEWTARGTALLQLHQDIEAERLKTTELTKEIGIASAELSVVNAMVMGETRRMWLNLDEESRSRLMQENPELAPMMSALTFITPTP